MASNWLEVSLVVDGEMAEAVAEVLARFAPNGVVMESTAVKSSAEDVEGRVVGPLKVSAYLPVDHELEEKRQRLREALWYLGRIRPLPDPQFRPLEQVDWSESWKKNYHPVEIGTRLRIVPAWIEPPDDERLPVRIDPGMAFGTGTHPTTQLCLEILEDLVVPAVEAGRPPVVIDVGCGSAILSIAALKLGATRALGVDIDEDAIAAARKNAEMNGAGPELELGIGSVEEVRLGRFGMAQAPLVLANILARVILHLFEAGLGELVTPGGALVLSGILDEQAEDVIAAARSHGLDLAEARQQEDWVALIVRRPAAG